MIFKSKSFQKEVKNGSQTQKLKVMLIDIYGLIIQQKEKILSVEVQRLSRV